MSGKKPAKTSAQRNKRTPAKGIKTTTKAAVQADMVKKAQTRLTKLFLLINNVGRNRAIRSIKKMMLHDPIPLARLTAIAQFTQYAADQKTRKGIENALKVLREGHKNEPIQKLKDLYLYNISIIEQQIERRFGQGVN
ncbi:hypothetical protein KKG83_01925 [Candidatus Micrarchaeota archaeon]|nr:hypothetical protein [Candidatus Micrarchaeota archaeon]MBU2476208.1 hypothetical protein [Candidatus Micrarchaeota archaeon]